MAVALRFPQALPWTGHALTAASTVSRLRRMGLIDSPPREGKKSDSACAYDMRPTGGLLRPSLAAICCGRPPLRLGGRLASSVPQRCPGKLVEVPNPLKSLG